MVDIDSNIWKKTFCIKNISCSGGVSTVKIFGRCLLSVSLLPYRLCYSCSKPKFVETHTASSWKLRWKQVRHVYVVDVCLKYYNNEVESSTRNACHSTASSIPKSSLSFWKIDSLLSAIFQTASLPPPASTHIAVCGLPPPGLLPREWGQVRSGHEHY